MAVAGASNRWFGVGHGTAPDAGTACAEAVASAIDGRDAAILFVFTSVTQGLSAIAEAARAAVGPGTAVVGGTSFGEITPSGSSVGGVVAVAIGGDGVTVRTALSRDASLRQRDAGIEVATAVGRTDRPHEVLLLVPDGAIGRQHEIVRGAYSVVGATVPMAGGCTGDLRYVTPHQFYGDHRQVEVFSDGVIAVRIGSDAPIGVGMAHGWHAYGAPMSVTSSEEAQIREFDHQPALDAYLRRVGGDVSILDDPAAVADLTLKYPLGLARRSGVDIRIICTVDAEDRSMTCFADVPQGALAWLMDTDRKALIDSGRDACEQAMASLDGRPPIGVIAFNCGVRRMMLEEDVDAEVATMAESALGAPVAGCYSMGEIARIRGARGMHHLTAVTVAFG